MKAPKAAGLRLPVDVFLVGAPDGQLMILVGNFLMAITSEGLGHILSGGELPQAREPKPKRNSHGLISSKARVTKGHCARCPKPVVKGKRLCRKHLKINQAGQARGVANRKKAAES